MRKPKVQTKKIDWEELYDFDLSWLITEARLKKVWTQERLAKAIGTMQPSIARAECGATRPSHILLKKIAKAVGMKLVAPRFSRPERGKAAKVV